jgi:hypothetical protein
VTIVEAAQEEVKQIEQPKVERPTPLRVVKPNTDQEPIDRVRKVLKKEPEISDRRLGKLIGLAPATAKKYRTQLNVSSERNRA